MSQKLKIISIVLSFVLACLTIAYFYIGSETQKPEMETLEFGVQNPENFDVPTEIPTTSTQEDAVTATSDVIPKENTDGIHIMADGSVMDREGKVIVDALILQDGTIQLRSGTIVTPQFDMRPKKSIPSVVPQKNEHIVVDIVGTDFEYDIKQITVRKGDTVTINFKSDEGFHDWVVDEFKAATKRVNEGGVTSVTFVADTVGTFQYYCSVMSHRQMGMVGYIVVEES